MCSVKYKKSSIRFPNRRMIFKIYFSDRIALFKPEPNHDLPFGVLKIVL